MSSYPQEPPQAYTSGANYGDEKHYDEEKNYTKVKDVHAGESIPDDIVTTAQHNPLSRKLQSRHMQMIAIGEQNSIQRYGGLADHA